MEEEEKNKELDENNLSNKQNIIENENPNLTNNNSEVFRHMNLQKIKINEVKDQQMKIQTDSQNNQNQNTTEANLKNNNLMQSTFNFADNKNYYLRINRCLTAKIKKIILIIFLIISTLFVFLSIFDILNYKNIKFIMNNLIIFIFQLAYALSLLLFQGLTIILQPKDNIIFNIISVLFISLIVILRTVLVIKNDNKKITMLLNFMCSFCLTFINIGIFFITLKILKMKKNVQQNIEEIINFTDIFQATNSKINDKKDNTLMLNNLGSENKTEIENQNDKKGISILVEETNKNGKPK
jgi:hypothetical protein